MIAVCVYESVLDDDTATMVMFTSIFDGNVRFVEETAPRTSPFISYTALWQSGTCGRPSLRHACCCMGTTHAFPESARWYVCVCCVSVTCVAISPFTAKVLGFVTWACCVVQWSLQSQWCGMQRTPIVVSRVAFPPQQRVCGYCMCNEWERPMPMCMCLCVSINTHAGPYTHLTLPTNREVETPVYAVYFKKQQTHYTWKSRDIYNRWRVSDKCILQHYTNKN